MSWIISIASIIILSSLLSIILPEGKTSKNIKAIFSILIIFVIIQPITKLHNTDFNTQIDSTQNIFEIQEDFVFYITDQKMTNYKNHCQKFLENIGINGGAIFIDYTIEQSGQTIIHSVNVNLQNAVINSEKEHIDIIEQVILHISNLLSIDKNLVKIHE